MNSEFRQVEKRCLFCCESVYQLFNAIVIHTTMNPDEPSDIVLTDHTDFSSITDRLRKTGIFENVYNVECVIKNREFYSYEVDARSRCFENPELLWSFPTPYDYSDFYVPLDHIYWKFIYYMKLKSGTKPAIHLFEEGLRAYNMNVFAAEEKEAYNTGCYGENSFTKAISEFLLYEPELYAVEGVDTPIRKIPKIDKSDRKLMDALTTVYPCDDFPKEKYIFFEESYVGDKKLSNDFQLFEEIAEIVGKNNIIVKRHPRNRIDRFTPNGYKVMANWKSPWEAQLTTSDVSDKVFITVSSTASVTPFLLFDTKVTAIHLLNMFRGSSPLLEEKAFLACYKNLIDMCNRDGMCVYSPSTMREVREILHYYNVCGGVK